MAGLTWTRGSSSCSPTRWAKRGREVGGVRGRAGRPRQNGKDAILEARELAGLFLLGERLLIHSAHQFDTSLEHFRRLLFLIENTDDFDASGSSACRARTARRGSS
jgi:hypothetical protein